MVIQEYLATRTAIILFWFAAAALVEFLRRWLLPDKEMMWCCQKSRLCWEVWVPLGL